MSLQVCQSDSVHPTTLLPTPHATPSSVLNSSADVKALTSDGPDIIPSLAPAFERYNQSQLATVKLPGASQEVCCPSLNRPLTSLTPTGPDQ